MQLLKQFFRKEKKLNREGENIKLRKKKERKSKELVMRYGSMHSGNVSKMGI